ncbi:hypothetical protein GFL38_10465 [Rhizobium leguminosarum bv. viciae]|uniref:hypothetical protein n=1 Tax=Rhizobium ruizarguesonis TaxID=2081791 RepID=UPI00143F213C|nr:hypothetical protein [Rhizobium ruizarguesonis]NKJ72687.1 hypothetical protein [Rhizobium leguminosarum bv. viciae]NKQ80366.1 hypothetical protein [Rhizobium ruizarguesonis]
MPRPRNARNESRRAAQERYRRRLREIRRPEAPRVDGAVAAAFAVALARVRRMGERNATIEAIIADAKELLIAAGYAPNEAVKKLMMRLLYRDDLAPLDVATRNRIGASR